MFRRLFAAMVITLQFLALSAPLMAQESVRGQEKTAEPKTETPIRDEDGDEDEDPDLPAGVKMDKGEYKRLRNEQIDFYRGLPYSRLDVRNNAVYEMMRQEAALRNLTGEPDAAPNAAWQPLGPAPIPNGQTTTRVDPVSGRVSAISVHPTNPNIAYVGTAQGGVYRTLDGGVNWTPLLDNALSLAIGSIAIVPSDPTTVFVGTGEAGFSADSFFGVGIYRITTADTNPVVAGPLNAGAGGADVFNGRSISEIMVHPTNPNILFASTTTGTCGIGGCTGIPGAAAVGIYRTSNALAATPTFEKLTIQGTLAASRSVIDLAIEPGNANRLIAAVVGTGGDGGIYLSTDALAATPTFTRTLATGDGAELGRAELAVQKTGATVTVYVASGTGSGTVFKSVDGGATFPNSLDNNFCSGQCFYDIAIAVDPTNANNVYLGGSASFPFGKSTDGGATFPISAVGLHVDSHAIAVSPSNPAVIYFGSDGGVWRSTDTGTNWTSMNTAALNSIQFQSLSLHPTDRYFMIGGTQDNGTEWLKPNNTWVRATGGDGGQTVIDQNATDTTNVTGYHTFFNQAGTQIGYQRISTFNAAGTTQAGVFRGCSGTGTAFGINCNDPVLFYAPLARGPGNPNTVYIGTNKLYRSANRGDLHDVVSQTFAQRLSAIGIAPSDDNVRLVGLTNGQVFLSTTASATTMTDVTGAIAGAPRYVSRTMIDPTNVNTAYVTLTGYGLTAGQHVWKTTNLTTSATPTWTPAGAGIPDVPVNAFAIDPANGQNLYAGTDIGVYRSIDGGTSWTPFNEGLPRVAVFDMALQNANRILRVATHGKGIWEMNLVTAPSVRRAPADFDGDGKTDVSVFRPGIGAWYILNSSNNGFQASSFGQNGDFITPGDYDGDGRADLSVFRSGAWYRINSQSNTFTAVSFGQAGDDPVAADYDGDGKTDTAVFRNGTWFIINSQTNTFRAVGFGQNGDLASPGDFDADGKADLAVFRPSNGTWYVIRSADNSFQAVQFGQNGDKPVVGDYDNDNRADYAVYRPSNGAWYLLQSTGGFRAVGFGIAEDIPTQGDYDGDGRTDFAVFRPSTSAWYILASTTGFRAVTFGQSGDVPAPSAYNALQ